MNKFFGALCAASAAMLAATPASAVIIHDIDIIVQRSIWVQFMSLFGG